MSTTLPSWLSMLNESLLTHPCVPANSGAQLPTSPPRSPSQGSCGATGVAVGIGVSVGSVAAGVSVGSGAAVGSGCSETWGVGVAPFDELRAGVGSGAVGCGVAPFDELRAGAGGATVGSGVSAGIAATVGRGAGGSGVAAPPSEELWRGREPLWPAALWEPYPRRHRPPTSTE